MRLLDRFFQGDRLALARIITWIENDGIQRETLLHALYPHTGRARRIGLTGPPGAGKSTLVSRLIGLFRQEGRTVGVIAVDPTSPFTGGALLGDRLRMQSAWADPGVFIRSMADRTHAGGLSSATPDVMVALDAFGMDVILVETVGVGQSTLDIAEVTDTTVVVLTPESGDSIQAMKAGLMEIADILVVNKDDRTGASHFASELRMMLDMRQPPPEWLPPVLRTSARDNTGIETVYEQLHRHRAFLSEHGHLEVRRLRQSRSAVARAIRDRLDQRIGTLPDPASVMDRLAGRVALREMTPLDAADEILDMVGIRNREDGAEARRRGGAGAQNT
jgi:LAO/AO transport system kinase